MIEAIAKRLDRILEHLDEHPTHEKDGIPPPAGIPDPLCSEDVRITARDELRGLTRAARNHAAGVRAAEGAYPTRPSVGMNEHVVVCLPGKAKKGGVREEVGRVVHFSESRFVPGMIKVYVRLDSGCVVSALPEFVRGAADMEER